MYQEYTVKAGDTVYGISKQFGVEAIDISTLNNLGGSIIQIGQVLKIPNKSGNNPSGLFTYTVKKGDSLYSIARVYETTVEDINRLNHLTSNTLSIGQQLLIPETDFSVSTKPNFTTYTVKKGDTLYSISKNYNIPVNTLIVDNALQSNTLSIGQVLNIRIPTTSVVLECFGDDYNPPTNEIKYTVKKGDSLYSIAKKYNTSVSNIINKNKLTSTNLSIGQILII
ncbi:MAG: LysM peptidoglycan-binding domain-containing protein [Bacilli bacterium]|nr:LysM peptidoglycan-binding domain-containing protein [Bacilli bacterium]